MRDTTVEVSKLTKVGNTPFYGGRHVVTTAQAAELEKSGNAKILDAPKAEAKPKTGLSAEGDK